MPPHLVARYKVACPFKQYDWVAHPRYGTGQVQTASDKAYKIRFVEGGAKDILVAFPLEPAQPPSPGFAFPTSAKPARGALNPRSKALRPAFAFSHLVERFTALYAQGFNDPKYIEDERKYKLAAAALFDQTLSRDKLHALIQISDFEAVRKAAQALTTTTNFIYPIALAKMGGALRSPDAKRDFAPALFNLLYGSDEQAVRFDNFVSVTERLGFPFWTVATYFPFFATRGESMFMKVSISKFIAAVVEIPLEYETRPNSRTFGKLQQIATETTSRLHAAGLHPRDGFDTQSFMFVTWFDLEGVHQRNRATTKAAVLSSS